MPRRPLSCAHCTSFTATSTPQNGVTEASPKRRSEAGAAAGSIEVYIHRLRRKLEGSGLSIRTVRGLGYLLEAETAS